MLIDQLKDNKGTVSSQLGKALAVEVLEGNLELLKEAVVLCSYELHNKKEKGIRAGAAKIVEKVAEVKPELVAIHLEELFPALDAAEPQTRWMIIRTFGYCAKDNDKTAGKAIHYAQQFIREQKGVCLSGAAERYLGDLGHVSEEYAQKAYPILVEAYDNAIPNEIDWIFEAFISIAIHLNPEQKKVVADCAKEHLEATRKATVTRAKKILKLCE